MNARLPLSVIIIARDEEDRLPRALASLSWAEEVIVVDSGSIDATAEIARRAGARLIEHAWAGYSAQKVFAVSQTTHDWVLWVDADEEISPPLQLSITRAMERQAGGEELYAAYEMSRRTAYLGRYLRHGGWYPDRKVRLFQKERCQFDGRAVHEAIRVTGTIGCLDGDLLHYSFRDLNHHIRKTQEMAWLWAQQERGRRRARGGDLLLRPLAKGIKSYLLRGGFREGWRGLLLAGMGSYSVWLKYALLRAEQGQCDLEKESSRAG